MSKKKRRYHNKRKKKKTCHCLVCDKHHILFIKKRWSKGILDALRTHHYCVISIPKCTLHHYIHENIHEIPAPSPIAAKYALEQLEYLDMMGALPDTDPICKRLNVLAALFDCSAQPTADALKLQAKIVHRYYNEPP